MWIKYYRLPNNASWLHTAITTRPPILDEASTFFNIPKSTLARWTLPHVRERILQQSRKESCLDSSATFVCKWLNMETLLWEIFIARRKQGRPVRDRQFCRKAKELWNTVYPELQQLPGPGLFVFSHGWFHGFLARHRIVLHFVTNTAQTLPENHKREILLWLRFNRRNRILTPLVPIPLQSPASPLSLHYICNDDQGGIPDHRICNIDETPLPWEHLTSRTYDLKGTKTVWSKSAESGSERHQCTLFLCIFADGVPRYLLFLFLLLLPVEKYERERVIYGISVFMLNFHLLGG